MTRRLLAASGLVIAVGAMLAGGAGATAGVRATLTHAVQPGPPGTRVVVAWKLRDASGRVVLDKDVFVRITCPEGDVSTTTYGSPNAEGIYLVHALVPRGGVGSITIGQGGSVFPVTNPSRG